MVLADFSLGAVTAMVHFLYSGELISDRATLPELRTIASQLGLNALKRHVVRSSKMVSGVSETQPQDDLEDRLEQERKRSQDGEQAIASLVPQPTCCFQSQMGTLSKPWLDRVPI